MNILYINPTYKNLFFAIEKAGFKRKRRTQSAYKRHLIALSENNIDPNDHVMKFFTGDESVVIVPSEYPYALPSPFRHHIMCIKGKVSSEEINEAVNRFYESENIEVVAVFTNEFTKRSVKQVNYAHIFLDTLEQVYD